MKKFYFGMSVDDVALQGWSKPENFQHLVEFFTAEEVPATFFVVPIDEESNQPFYTLDDRYLPIIRNAHAAGFDFEQHGLRHNRFELGVPPDQILSLPHEAENKRYAAENAEFLKRDHSLENCRARLRQGREILENAFGFPVRGFRSPALQESPALFPALAAEGYEFDGSALMQWTGYDYIMGRMDVEPLEFNRQTWLDLRKKFSGVLLPMTCDYTWYLTPEKYDRMLRMAKHDLAVCLREDIPFVTVCHIDPVHDGEGLRLLRELYRFARLAAAEAGREIEFATLKTIAKDFKA